MANVILKNRSGTPKTYNGVEDVILRTESGTDEVFSTGVKITVDDHLSTTSTNPVQNKVVTAAINTINSQITGINNQIPGLQTGSLSSSDIDDIINHVI